MTEKMAEESGTEIDVDSLMEEFDEDGDGYLLSCDGTYTRTSRFQFKCDTQCVYPAWNFILSCHELPPPFQVEPEALSGRLLGKKDQMCSKI